MPAGELDPRHYDVDPDGLPRAIVGPWVHDKHTRLRKYVGISRSVRSKFLGPTKAGATYIDLFAGPGRAVVRDTKEAVDGSPLVAWEEAVRSKAPFERVYIADRDQRLLEACYQRLKKAGAPVHAVVGSAVEALDQIYPQLNPHALHFAFLDPYNLGSLPFALVRRLASLQRMDILAHISAMDLQMNARSYARSEAAQLDAFTPGWRQYVDVNSPDDALIRGQILKRWADLLLGEGMRTTESHELVVGPKNQHLYWLAFAARHEQAHEFWEKIRTLDGQLNLL